MCFSLHYLPSSLGQGEDGHLHLRLCEGLKLAGLVVEYGTLAFENLLRMCQVSTPGRLTLNPRVNERVSDTRNLPTNTCLFVCQTLELPTNENAEKIRKR